ncbi:Uma2 family endonuclease [Dyadobacter chenwenxiniae]|uniref:Uma2 family endonuclease n=1 Tax=Dyadobacter chenwenxiniae TaxID=2906456 RepID=A0A9X1PIA6_9BACT|nr:Uma2 family endonuclease [Dyadobacter chenwenxiniae]MCF0061882.1 Uma2 family endonuclease [Dyadobacter chenwenxiniae]UON81697.1 Uma2 family endonuclease [Dyadobacter chenwenxiniae]
MSALITDLSQLDPNGTFTYADYIRWRIEERIELIKGKIFKMSPAPNLTHQRISTQLQGAIFNFLAGRSCDLFSAPFDVRLYNLSKSAVENSDIYTVVQPDLCIVCDKNKLDERGCLGAPDLVIEILSPGNSRREMDDKFELYQECGVREYWLVEPAEYAVFVYVRNEKGEFIGLKPATKSLQSSIFPELVIDLDKAFGK